MATGPRGAAGARDDVEGCDGIKEGKSEPEGEKTTAKLAKEHGDFPG